MCQKRGNGLHPMPRRTQAQPATPPLSLLHTAITIDPRSHIHTYLPHGSRGRGAGTALRARTAVIHQDSSAAAAAVSSGECQQ